MRLRTVIVASLALPLALGLAACKKEGSAPSGAAIAKIAPPAGKSWSDVVDQTADGVRMGNPDAPIKLVEYGSLSCPHCAKLSQEGYQTLVNDFVASGRVSWEFRSYAIHPQDIPLTLLATCAGKDTVFPLAEQIYTNFDAMNAPLQDKAVQERANAASALPAAQRMPALADALGYTQFFAQRGVAKDQANACLADTAKAQKIADAAAKWGQAGIDSTPTLIVNDAKLDTSEWEGLQQALRAAGAR